MRASHVTPARRAWLSLAAAALALTVWGVTLLAHPQLSSDLAQHPTPGMQLAEGGGPKPGG